MAAGRRDVFAVDEDQALAELELTWAAGGYHGFSADGGTWSRDQQRRRSTHRRHTGRAEPDDPGALADNAMTTGRPGMRLVNGGAPEDAVVRRAAGSSRPTPRR